MRKIFVLFSNRASLEDEFFKFVVESFGTQVADYKKLYNGIATAE
jgi:hypothetical protein